MLMKLQFGPPNELHCCGSIDAVDVERNIITLITTPNIRNRKLYVVRNSIEDCERIFTTDE
jgi:hypothetical protein